MTTNENTCWNCDEPCSLYSEYEDDGRTFCSLDCLNEATDRTSEVLEHGLTLNSETMSFYDESGNEYRDENGQAIYYSEVDTARL